ncbi:hypothetical protein [Bacillus sp. FJAT-45066]|uniref:hypothetical protein n=1 Tax=Bacillus sp. FJAT-45066 TaxID=2011010 RepID=UPI001144E79A|nr:hypothetical protein [Bacillus sp. FJAT-45066]
MIGFRVPLVKAKVTCTNKSIEKGYGKIFELKNLYRKRRFKPFLIVVVFFHPGDCRDINSDSRIEA